MITQTPVTREAVRDDVIAGLADPVVAAFQRHWYGAKSTWSLTTYRGVPTLKCPCDMQIYHEIIMAQRPALIIETGTAWGGSAAHFADCMTMSTGHPRVMTVDLMRREPALEVPGVTRLLGDSVSAAVVDEITAAARMVDGPVMVSLDSSHDAAHVAAELRAYAPLVTRGAYCVVEDTNTNGHPVDMDCAGGGPAAAVDGFLADHPEFQREPLCERYLLTMHPGGWLYRAAH